jgi:hypothetical protein
MGVLLQRLGGVTTVLASWLWLAVLTIVVGISPDIRHAPLATADAIA